MKITVDRKSVSYDAAARVVADVIAKAQETLGPGKDTKSGPEELTTDPVGVVIVGVNAHVVAQGVMDNLRPGIAEFCVAKARSALELGIPTGGLAGYLTMLGHPFNARDFGPGFTAFAGGDLLRNADGEIIGAIGVNGRLVSRGENASLPPQDAELAAYGAARLLELERQ